jgi:2-hydroxychromene-2-carboxylate isomerase
MASAYPRLPGVHQIAQQAYNAGTVNFPQVCGGQFIHNGNDSRCVIAPKLCAYDIAEVLRKLSQRGLRLRKHTETFGYRCARTALGY